MRCASFLALLVQLAWSTALPVLHAESEVLASQAAFESTHSADCPKLHDPAHGATCSVLSAPVARTVHFSLPPVDPGRTVSPVSSIRVTDSTAFSSLHLARSPPVIR